VPVQHYMPCRTICRLVTGVTETEAIDYVIEPSLQQHSILSPVTPDCFSAWRRAS